MSRNTKHGYAQRGRKTPTYSVWEAMKKRCFNHNDRAYRWYGARGIRVCDRWVTDFGAFLSDMGTRPAGLTLDRIDADGNYEPGNCRWATWEQQRANRRPRPSDDDKPAEWWDR